MRKLIVCSTLICILFTMSGCINQGTTSEKTFENIIFESEFIELHNAYIDFDKEEMYDDFGETYFNIRSVDVKFLFHNPLNKTVTFVVNVYLYDENNTLLYAEEPYQTINLPEEYTERNVNVVSYDGRDVNLFHHAKIVIDEQ